MRPLLSTAERTALIVKAQCGQITKDQLAAMNLMPSDEWLIEGYLPRVVTWGTPLCTPDRMTILAKAVQDKRHGQEFRDPLQFLLHGDEDAVRRLIDDENDWRYVEQERRKHITSNRKDDRNDDTSEEN